MKNKKRNSNLKLIDNVSQTSEENIRSKNKNKKNF